MKEFIEEIWRRGKKIYNHKWRKLKSLQASHLNPQVFLMFFKLFKPPKSALEVPQVVFFQLPSNALIFPFYMLRILAKTRSCDVLSPVARRLACHWRDSRDGMPLACQLPLWRRIGSPVARQLASRWQADLDFKFLAFLCFFFSFVASLGFHRATITCPPLPTQARERVEEFPFLKYTRIKLQISHKWMVFLFESLSSNICVFCYLCIIKKSVN